MTMVKSDLKELKRIVVISVSTAKMLVYTERQNYDLHQHRDSV